MARPPEILVAPTRAVLDRLSAGAIALGVDEAQRAASLRNCRDADDFTAARLLARFVILRVRGWGAAVHQRAVRLDQRCPTCGSTDHGRPLPLPDGLHVSWAHARGVVAAAASSMPIGIDVEPLDAADECMAVWPEDASVPPLELLARWVEGEAAVKCGLLTLDELLTNRGSTLPSKWHADHVQACGAMLGWVTKRCSPPPDITAPW